MQDFDDILSSIRRIAHGHEEPYKDGAWEAFLKNRKKKQKAIFAWSLVTSGLVASLVIGFFFIPSLSDKKTGQEDLSDAIYSIVSPVEAMPKTCGATTKQAGVKKKTEPRQIENEDIQYEKNIIYPIAKNEKHADSPELNEDKNKHFINQENEQKNFAFEEEDTTSIFSANNIMHPSNNHYEFTKSLEEGLEEETPEKNKRKRLSLGFSISPLLATNDDGSHPGVSAGIQMDIPIYGKVSINSGLIFAHQKVENIYKNRSSFSEPLSLTSRLTSFDIPVNFKIVLKKEKNKESYLVAGISSVGYINERNTFTYEYEEVIEITTVREGQKITTYQTVLTEKNVENTEPAFSTFDFAGFMNLSYGLKSPFSKNMYLTLEPYIKLPLSGLTANNLRYTTGGVSLIISK